MSDRSAPTPTSLAVQGARPASAGGSPHRIYLCNLTGSDAEGRWVAQYAEALEQASGSQTVAFDTSRYWIRVVRAVAVLSGELDLRQLARADAHDRAASVQWRLHRQAVEAERRGNERVYRYLRRHLRTEPAICHRCGRGLATPVVVTLESGRRVAMSRRCVRLWQSGCFGRHTSQQLPAHQLRLFAVDAE